MCILHSNLDNVKSTMADYRTRPSVTFSSSTARELVAVFGVVLARRVDTVALWSDRGDGVGGEVSVVTIDGARPCARRTIPLREFAQERERERVNGLISEKTLIGSLKVSLTVYPAASPSAAA